MSFSITLKAYIRGSILPVFQQYMLPTRQVGFVPTQKTRNVVATLKANRVRLRQSFVHGIVLVLGDLIIRASPSLPITLCPFHNSRKFQILARPSVLHCHSKACATALPSNTIFLKAVPASSCTTVSKVSSALSWYSCRLPSCLSQSRPTVGRTFHEALFTTRNTVHSKPTKSSIPNGVLHHSLGGKVFNVARRPLYGYCPQSSLLPSSPSHPIRANFLCIQNSPAALVLDRPSSTIGSCAQWIAPSRWERRSEGCKCAT